MLKLCINIEHWSKFANNAVCNPIGDSVDIVESSENESPADNHLVSNNLLCGKVENLSETEGHFLIGHGFHDFTDVEGWNFYPSPSSLLIDAGISCAGVCGSCRCHGLAREYASDCAVSTNVRSGLLRLVVKSGGKACWRA